MTTMMTTTTTTTTTTNNNLQSMIYSNENGTTPKLSVLDQLLIPERKVYIEIPDVEAAWTVIRTMQIRGAPLIAMVAILGLAVDLFTNPKTIQALDDLEKADAAATGSDIQGLIQTKLDYLKTSRPTAVNLSNALEEVQQAMTNSLAATDNDSDTSTTTTTTTPRNKLLTAILNYAEFMLQRDVNDNRAIGKNGGLAILEAKPATEKVNVVTICNTGSLATAGYGTALGVVRYLHEADKLESITALETRPYNQGSRLTAFEIMEEKMPGGTLICDSAAGALMQTKKVDACVVGADRVCANGDTANKIGTYNLSLVANAHNVPFFVAAPITSLDITLESGAAIPIEERSSEELISTSKAPPGMKCWNPAFDVTPAKYITGGIITEKGVIKPDADGKLNVKAFVEKHTAA